jgi:uncharacterized protein (DUF58 family)
MTRASPQQSTSGIYTCLQDLLRLRFEPRAARQQQRHSPAPLTGPRTTRARGRGMDFAEVRAYQPGDDVRHIDWRVTARKDKVHTKVFHEERERPTLLLVDQSQSLFFGSQRCLKSVAAAEVAALLAWQASAVHDRVGGIVIGNQALQQLPAARQRGSVIRLLEAICEANQALHKPPATAPPRRTTTLLEACGQLRRMRPVGGRIYLISDFHDLETDSADDPETHLRSALTGLNRHNQICLIGVFDPLEAELPPPGDYQVRHAGRRLSLNTADRALRSRYRVAFEARQGRLAASCAALGMQWLPVSTALDPAAQLATALRT